MATLVERLGVEPHREKVIADCVTLIDHQVKSRGGMSGIAVRASYATIKAIKRRFVPEVVDGLLDEWLGKLQIDVAAARDELHARLARIEELQQQAAMLREVSVPRFRVQYGLPPTEQVEMRRQLDQLLDAKKWQPQVAAELRQFAPEVLALAANELAVTPPDGSGNERAARLRRFLEQITGYRGLRPEGENRLGTAQLAKVNAELGNLWMWYLNEVAPSKQVWDASQRVR